MRQSRLMSLVEALANVVVGYARGRAHAGAGVSAFRAEDVTAENLAIGAISPSFRSRGAICCAERLRRCAIDTVPRPEPLTGRAFSPIPGRMTELMGDPAGIDRILGARADRAVAIAKPIPARTYEIVGFVRSR